MLIKLAASLAVITTAVLVGRRLPSAGGLVATMPLTGLLVMVWLYLDTGGSREAMIGYSRGAALGAVPAVLFYLAVLACLRRGLPFGWALAAGFAVWILGAAVHRAVLQ